MNNIPSNIDYYILAGDGETLIDACSALIFAVDSETDFEDVEELVTEHYDDVVAYDIMGSLKYLPKVSTKPVDVVDLLTILAEGVGLTEEERRALLELRDRV